jgi:hypothetical protein
MIDLPKFRGGNEVKGDTVMQNDWWRIRVRDKADREAKEVLL